MTKTEKVILALETIADKHPRGSWIAFDADELVRALAPVIKEDPKYQAGEATQDRTALRYLNAAEKAGRYEYKEHKGQGYWRLKHPAGRPKVLPAEAKNVMIRMTPDEKEKVLELLKELRAKK